VDGVLIAQRTWRGPRRALGRIFELLALLGRSRDAKELEILVVRHELRVVSRARQLRRPAATR